VLSRDLLPNLGHLFYLWTYNRGLQCFKLNGNQTENERYWQKITFAFCKMSENVQFFSHLHLKFAKSAIMTQTFLFWKNINMGIKKAEFYADFKFVDASLNKCP
jgi:hypothetical protein